MKKVMLAAVCALFFVAPVMSYAADSGDSAAVNAVLDKLLHAWEANDPGVLAGVMAKDKDMVCFGADAAERWVAWASEVRDVTAKSGAEEVNLSGMRATYVLEKRKGAWLIVQMHYSMPVTGQAIKY